MLFQSLKYSAQVTNSGQSPVNHRLISAYHDDDGTYPGGAEYPCFYMHEQRDQLFCSTY